MTPEKQAVLWEKLVELKRTPGKAGETPEKRGEPNYVSTEHKGSEPQKLQVYLVDLEEKLVLSLETPWK